MSKSFRYKRLGGLLEPPLYVSSQQGYSDVVKLLLVNKANVNQARTTTGSSPLYVSSQKGHSAVVKLRLENKADLHQWLGYFNLLLIQVLLSCTFCGIFSLITLPQIVHHVFSFFLKFLL